MNQKSLSWQRRVLWIALSGAQKFSSFMGMWGSTARIARFMGERAALWSSTELAETLFKKGIELARRTMEPRQNLLALTALEEFYDQRREHEKRHHVLLQKIETRKQLGDLLGQVEDYSKVAACFLNRGLFERALVHAQRALELCPPEVPAPLQCHLRIQAASALAPLGKASQAEKLLNEAIEIASRKQEKGLEALAHHQRGLLFARNAQPTKAFEALKQALHTIKGAKNEILEAIFFDDLATLYLTEKQPQKSLAALQQALVRWRRNGAMVNAVQTCKQIVNLQCKIHEVEAAFDVLVDNIKFFRMSGHFSATEELKSMARDLIKHPDMGMHVPEGIEQLVSEAIAEELAGNSPHEGPGSLRRSRRKTAAAIEKAARETEDEKPMKVYELSERYIQSIFK